MSAGRRLVVLRHGVTEHNLRGIWQGHLDSDLSDAGLQQAQQAAPVVAGYAPELVVSSDLRRAAVTADTVVAALPGAAEDHSSDAVAGQARATRVQVRRDSRLREIHCGQWQGLETAQMMQRYPDAQALLASGTDFRRGVDGETYAELADRVAQAVQDVLSELSPGATALIVTHGVVARALVGDLLGMSRESSWLGLSTLGNCHWAELLEAGSHWRLARWNAGAVIDPATLAAPAHVPRFGTRATAG
ncbi:histidine phosphatase family protein [Gephyromycinifex aptenodytis]|uniref:histidine phosphatase family protein n=1 Tax=Gephyromycinifex aptenodytis TaxID=2716227 RepID=UPI001445B941|nr:histidine phosphatase family protein [Gephyromycinifex aptenodytis]